MAQSNQILPQKEAGLFKTVLKHYESKQFKKGLKIADTILAKVPQHGETLAMKGLILNCLDKKKEGEELIKLGIKNNMKSHICWHVYGLMYRSMRDYKEAIKCYKQALNRDKDNNQIMRDLSLLQAQTRDLNGFCETRRALLNANSKQRNNWIGFAVANHMMGSHEEALKVLQAYESTLEATTEPNYEHSEMLLYKCSIMQELGDLEGTLKQLNDSERLILDKVSLREMKGKILVELGRREDAQAVYGELLETNEENHLYHHGLLQAVQLSYPTVSEDDELKLQQIYTELSAKFPKSAAVKRIPLDFLTGQRFTAAVDAYVRPWLRKGVPSLFNDLKSLYKCPQKVKVVEDLFLSYLNVLKASQRFPALHTATGEPSTEAIAEETPVVVLWVVYYLAQHYDRLGDFARAFEYIDEAIVHTPTVMDLYLLKASISKHAGNLALASDCAETARKMDLADRCLNTVSVRHALKANRLELADAVVTLFTKDGENPNNLFEMQAMWFEVRYGNACLRLGQYGKALKKFTAVEKHFNDILDDQFDFHTYCIRKMTIRAYISMIRFEDAVYSNKYYVKAAMGCVKAYIALFDKPLSQQKKEAEEAELAGMSEAERKKYLSKKKRAEARKEPAKEEVKKEEKKKDDKGKKGSGYKKPVVDADPEGTALAQIEHPLNMAIKYLEKLAAFSKEKIEVHHLGCEVFRRMGKPLKMLQSLKKAQHLNANHPNTHKHLIHFLLMLQTERSGYAAAVQQVLDLELKEMFPTGFDLAQLNAQYLAANPSSIAHRLAAAECELLIKGNVNVSQVVSWVSECSLSWSDMDAAEAAYLWLKKIDAAAAAAAAAFHQKCRQVFKHSTFFCPELLPPPPQQQPAVASA